MTSESEGESDAQIAECQNPTCKAKGPKEDVSTKTENLETDFIPFFSFLAKENIFAVDYAPSDTGKLFFVSDIIIICDVAWNMVRLYHVIKIEMTNPPMISKKRNRR